MNNVQYYVYRLNCVNDLFQILPIENKSNHAKVPAKHRHM